MADLADSAREKVKVAFNLVLNTAEFANEFQLAQGAHRLNSRIPGHLLASLEEG